MRRARSLAVVAAVLVSAPGVSKVANSDHTRPRALAFDATTGMLFVALSTAGEVAIVDPQSTPRVVARRKVCRFPGAVVAKPGGGAIVACRFDPGLRVVERVGESWRVRTIEAGAESGARGLAVAPGGDVAYVASPATGGVKVVSLAGAGVVQSIATGISPRALRVTTANGRTLLLVSNFIEHTVSVHPIAGDGRLGEAVQSIGTEAPVLDLQVVGGELLLLTHEDRPSIGRTGRSKGWIAWCCGCWCGRARRRSRIPVRGGGARSISASGASR
jgi:hypothetical protein